MYLMNTMLDAFDRIKANNPWWATKSVIEEDSLILEFEGQKYRYFHPLIKDFPMSSDAVITVRGPRRVGKSTLIRLIIKKLLLEKKIPKEAIFFFPCDRVSHYNDLFEVVKAYLDFARPRCNSRLFIFLDEISFVTDWQKAIKEMADTGLLKYSLVLLTGSSILDLKFGSEFLAGRRGKVYPADIFYYPLSFKEFVNLVEPDLVENVQVLALSYSLPKLKKLYYDFLITGGFPKTINEFYVLSRIENSTYETLLTWFENDLHKTGRSEVRAYELINNIIRTLTTPVSFTKLARDSAFASHFAVQEYIEILEKMFILFPINTFLIDQKKSDPKKNKKIYFSDPFIFNALYLKGQERMENPYLQSKKIVDSDIFPNLVENSVAFHLRRLFPQLYRGKIGNNEVDFVAKKEGKLFFYEVKYQNEIKISDFDYFFKRKPKNKLTVVSKKRIYNSSDVNLLPVEIFLAKLR